MTARRADTEAIAARMEAATEGPWIPIPNDGGYDDDEPHDGWWLSGPDWYDTGEGYWFRRADAEFVAMARQDIPDLLADLAAAEQDAERLAEALARLHQDVPWHGYCAPCFVVDVLAAHRERVEDPGDGGARS